MIYINICFISGNKQLSKKLKVCFFIHLLQHQQILKYYCDPPRRHLGLLFNNMHCFLYLSLSFNAIFTNSCTHQNIYMKSWEVQKTIKEIDPFYSRWSKKIFHLIRWFESQQKMLVHISFSCWILVPLALWLCEINFFCIILEAILTLHDDNKIKKQIKLRKSKHIFFFKKQFNYTFFSMFGSFDHISPNLLLVSWNEELFKSLHLVITKKV